MDKADYPFTKLGPRPAPDLNDIRAFARPGARAGGQRTVPVAARRFQARMTAEITSYPDLETLPKWVLALVEEKVSVEEFARVVHERIVRAPSAENQRLALVLANEVARMPDGPEVVSRYLTPELLRRTAGEGTER